MREAVYAALKRFEAMSGQLGGIPENAEQQAERDREQFGEKYLTLGNGGEYLWHPLPVIRFMVEVCGIPLRESREAVIDDARESGVRMVGTDWTPPEQEARKFFATFGNILEAREYAAFLMELMTDDERAVRHWRDVLNAIDTLRFVPEDTGVVWD